MSPNRSDEPEHPSDRPGRSEPADQQGLQARVDAELLARRTGGDEDHPRQARRRDGGHSRDAGRWPTVKRALSEFRADQMTDQAAALTYYGVLALFPGLLVLVSILGLFGDPQRTTQTMTEILTELAPGGGAETLTDAVRNVTQQRGTAGVMFVVGVLGALWSASGYIGAFMRAANVAYETDEGRPFWKLRPLQLLLTLGAALLAALVLVGLVLTGPVVSAIAGPIGIGDQAVDVWNVAKWPVLLLIVMVVVAILFYAAPNARIPAFKLITPGAVLAILLWLVASAGFAFYVANFGSYDKTYGALGGAVTLLVWLWISNCALLLGVQLNAEAERSREFRAGIPGAEHELKLEHRSDPDQPATAGGENERQAVGAEPPKEAPPG